MDARRAETVYRLRSRQPCPFRDDARKRKDNIHHIHGRIIKTIASRRMRNINHLAKRQELQTTTRRNKQAARQRSLLILRRRRAAFDATKGRTLPCPSG
ncbi:hypothetical protein EEI76_22615 (plasmid) [Enterobacter cloacae]|uniref:Uncharacterized protein n=1 Tax=Klebsiella aerogenes TaxID=548 RepID=A0A221ZN74_KLEAE|nr:hypothetical protein [Klebsiella aerogenes]AYU97818.1 hypothetical protein EEI76_22615 [Enterobacter cloacae]